MGALIGGLCCAAGGIVLWEAVQWKVWGPPSWLPSWVPVGKHLDPDPARIPVYDEAADAFGPADLPRGHTADQVWLDEANPSMGQPLLGDDALAMLGDDALAMLLQAGADLNPAQTALVRDLYGPGPQTTTRNVGSCGMGMHLPPHRPIPDEADEPTPEPLSADAASSTADTLGPDFPRPRPADATPGEVYVPVWDGPPPFPESPDPEPWPDTVLDGFTPDPLDAPADQAVAAAMNAGTTPAVTEPADLPDWLTAPTRGTSKNCACGDRVPASAWHKPTHVAHRTTARAELDAATRKD